MVGLHDDTVDGRNLAAAETCKILFNHWTVAISSLGDGHQPYSVGVDIPILRIPH